MDNSYVCKAKAIDTYTHPHAPHTPREEEPGWGPSLWQQDARACQTSESGVAASSTVAGTGAGADAIPAHRLDWPGRYIQYIQ